VAEAEAWYRRAIDESGDSLDVGRDEDCGTHTSIMVNLAELLEDTGQPEEALSWYRRAANRSDAEAAAEAARLPGFLVSEASTSARPRAALTDQIIYLQKH
jgi:TPR repeat protein